MKANKDTHLRHNSFCSYKYQVVIGLRICVVICFVHYLAFLLDLGVVGGGGG